MKTKKNLFIKDLVYSIKNFDYYKVIHNFNTARAFKYLAILISIYAIVMTIGVTHEISETLSNVKGFVNSEVESLDYTDGILSVNNDESKSYYSNLITIDTSTDSFDNYNSNIIFVKDKFRLNVEENIFDFRYSDFIKDDFDKQSLIDALDIKKYIFMIVFCTLIVSYVVLFVSTLLDILVISIIGLIISSVIGNNKSKYKNIFNISVHSITLSVVLAMIYLLVNKYTGFEIKYFSTMYTSLATIYMATAILLMRADNR